MQQKQESDGQLIHFQITLDEANVIFKALGQMPFADVYALIGKLNEQANRQLNHPNSQQNQTRD
ncbi:hypothetical protein [Microscilla marina]|uniref:Uncharacterized protein n=1 Tax=Microscilla marina ATCC 23134 TaxID=313606 RepID=A1ZX09_MICM2|nr:hypothetical protein [Microscilla marina]EAY25089.1 hypothetical protein M23134_06077 [Microscilla marina ATCC 23134]